MKRILAGLCVLVSAHTYAQTQYNLIGSTGKVGIGTTSPSEPLTVNGNAQIDGTNPFVRFGSRFILQHPSMVLQNGYARVVLGNNIRWNSATNMWKVDNGPNDDFSMIQFAGSGSIDFYTRPATGASYEISQNDLVHNYLRMYIDKNGGVGIATLDIKGYKLAVGGKAIFTEAYVKLEQNWPDYVFEKDYQLLPLPELEKFIQQNKHLPEVPTADEVAKDGLNLGTTQAALLKKIEELTLYIIEQNKKLEMQNRKIEEHDGQMKEMKTMILELKGVAKNTGN